LDNIADYISKSYDKALDERDDAEDEFDKLDSTTSDEQRAKWASQEAQAHADRLSNVKAMDIYLSKLEAGQLCRQMPRCILTSRRF
jgi:predicted enzyme involved in methoxymalonyl-ACP biosynthesis